MWGRNRRKWTGHGPDAHYVEPTTVPPDLVRGQDVVWLGTRYEYLLFTGLPLGDTNQKDLTAAGARGWRVVQVGTEQTHTGYATGVWALCERELPPQGQDLPLFDRGAGRSVSTDFPFPWTGRGG